MPGGWRQAPVTSFRDPSKDRQINPISRQVSPGRPSSGRRAALHIIGCTSPGGIHSHVDHLIALLELARRSQVPHVFVHVITDGQDMPPQDGINVLKLLKPHLDKANARIASIQGRSYAMDRVLNWELTERVWHAIALGDAPPISDPEAYLTEAYQRGESDYSLLPATVVDNGTPIGALHDNDAVIFFDFRNDRIRQLAKPLIYMGQFTDFNLVRTCSNVRVVTMTKYADEFTVPVAYPAPELAHVLGEIISQRGWRQWRIAEKEKEAHVTNFFNGGRITPFVGEERDIVSSRMMKGREYVEHPEMSLGSITETIRQKISDDAALYVVNIANPDMIGHTGDLGATIQAMRITDAALNTIVTSIIAQPDTAIIITADHGNAEELLDPLTSGADTQHSTRTVPAIFVAPELKNADHSGKNLESLAQEAPIGTLVDIAPTILYLLGIDKPEEMTGTRLLTVGDSKT